MQTVRVYPRVCGGTPRDRSGVAYREGLSPRVRGNRSICICIAAADWVYPRVCGGTGRHMLAGHISAGLSPRVRGNLLSVCR